MMRATRFCAYAALPHALENAISASASVAAHGTAGLRSTGEVANRRRLWIQPLSKRTVPSLSIADLHTSLDQRTWMFMLGSRGVFTSTLGALTTGEAIAALTPAVATPVTLRLVVLTPAVPAPVTLRLVVLMCVFDAFEPPPMCP